MKDTLWFLYKFPFCFSSAISHIFRNWHLEYINMYNQKVIVIFMSTLNNYAMKNHSTKVDILNVRVFD